MILIGVSPVIQTHWTGETPILQDSYEGYFFYCNTFNIFSHSLQAMIQATMPHFGNIIPQVKLGSWE
jgi:hypothetical protein